MDKTNKNRILFSAIAGVIPAIFTVVGYTGKHYHGVFFSPFILLAFISIWIVYSAISFLVYNLSDYLSYSRKAKSNSVELDKKKNRLANENLVYLISFVVFLFAWFPAFLAFYPGIFAYDNQWQYFMYVNNDISTHQPVIHTLILGFIISTFEKTTGSINKGVAAYTIFQMIIMSFGLAYIPYLLRRMGVKTLGVILSIVFFSLYPVFVIFVFTGTKDSIFSVAVADYFGLNICLLSERNDSYFVKKQDAPVWGLLAFTILSFRSNAIYALIPMLMLLSIYVIKHCKRKKGYIIAISVVLMLFLVYKYPIMNFAAKNKVSQAEMMSVPCQQISRVYHYHYDDLSKEDIDAYDTLFDQKIWYGYYVPEIADASKGSLRMDVYSSDKSIFWSLWKKWLKEYPKEYVDSFIENTYGLFYMWPRYVLYSYGQEGYTVIHPMQPAESNSKLPALFKFYEQFENGRVVQKDGYISWIFAPATYLYALIVTLIYAVKRKKWELCIPFVFIVLLWMTFLLGPVSMVRYMLFLYILAPLLPKVYSSASKDVVLQAVESRETNQNGRVDGENRI